VCVCACVRACVRACVCVCVRVRVSVMVQEVQMINHSVIPPAILWRLFYSPRWQLSPQLQTVPFHISSHSSPSLHITWWLEHVTSSGGHPLSVPRLRSGEPRSMRAPLRLTLEIQPW